MAAIAAQAAIFVLSTGVSIVLTPLLDKLIPKPPPLAVSTVSIGLGLCAQVSDTCGGNTPGVTLWNTRGQYIGESFGSKQINPDDQPISVTVNARPSVGNDVAYVSITNGGDDAICINLISISDSIGVPKTISGDVFKTCGADWFPSSQVVDTHGSMPACIWIDRDHSNGLRFQGLGFHTGSFGNFPDLAQQYTDHPDSMCNSGPRLKMYKNITTEDPILTFQPPITFNPDGTDADMSKIIGNPGVLAETAQVNLLKAADANFDRRMVSSNSTSIGIFMEGHVIISAHESHSAKEVCESSTSRGPDFVALHEGFHCDMTTRKLSQVCSTAASTCCFDAQTSQMRSCTSSPSIRGRTVALEPSKSYKTTIKWGWE